MGIDNKESKFQIIANTIANIEKAYGKGSIMKLGDKPVDKFEVISTGCLSLDHALGVGGIPKGRIIEIYGPESGGKTTMTLHVIAEAQKVGGIAAFIDAEHALDIRYAKSIGVDISNLYVSQPDYGEQALEIVDHLVRSNAFDIIVVDSVAALVPRTEIEGEMGDPQMAAQARLMSQALRKLAGVVARSHTTLIFTNQLRSKIGVMFGNPETTTGGNALKFYASVRLDVRRISTFKSGGEATGNRVKVKVVKNKVAPPFREVEIDIVFGKGIDAISDLVDLAINFGIIKKGGAWFTYGEDRYQGKEQLMNALSSCAPAISNLKLEVLQSLSTGEVTSTASVPVEEEEIKPE